MKPKKSFQKSLTLAANLIFILFIFGYTTLKSQTFETQRVITTYSELIDCVDCKYLAIHGEYLFIAKSNSIHKLNVNNYNGNLIEVYSGSESFNSIAVVDNYLYTLSGQRFGRIDLLASNPEWELFHQSNFVDANDIPYSFSSLIAYGTDLYFGVYCDDCDPGSINKLNTSDSQNYSYIGSIGRYHQSLICNDSFIYASSAGMFWDMLYYVRINLTTLESEFLYAEYDPENKISITSKPNDNYIYTTYELDIYRYETNTTFNQELIYDFVDVFPIKAMLFFGDDLYCIRNNKIGWFENFTSIGNEEVIVSNNHVMVFPNPTNKKISIKTSENIRSVMFYDILGRQVKQSSDKEIDVSVLTAGTYFVKVVTDTGKTAIKKMIKS